MTLAPTPELQDAVIDRLNRQYGLQAHLAFPGIVEVALADNAYAWTGQHDWRDPEVHIHDSDAEIDGYLTIGLDDDETSDAAIAAAIARGVVDWRTRHGGSQLRKPTAAQIRQAKEDRYFEAVTSATDQTGMKPWLTPICPECGMRVDGFSPDGDHRRDDDGNVIVGCEGYFVVNPATVGLDDLAVGWDDWRPRVIATAQSKLDAFYRAGYDLLVFWQMNDTVVDSHMEDGYPFDKSFDELICDLQNWTHGS